MGITGTEVPKEAVDMILRDKLASISQGVEEVWIKYEYSKNPLAHTTRSNSAETGPFLIQLLSCDPAPSRNAAVTKKI